MFVTLIDTRLVTSWRFISETHNQVLQLPVTTSGKKKQKKIGQSDYCWKYVSVYVTFLWSYSLP